MKDQGQVRLHVRGAKGGSRGGRTLRSVWSAVVLGGLVWTAPAVSSAKERCATKPMVCARLKAMRAAEAERAQREAYTQPSRTAWLQAGRAERCTTKPTVCARLRNAPAVAAPVYLAGNSGAERGTTKPAVCARLKLQRSAAPVTLAKEGMPSSID
jgi:hypothetical protein